MQKHTQLGVEKGFFDHPREGSRVKQEIIAKYFNAYMNKMARGRAVGYADLFAGPGLYRNGEKSTPILTCERVIADERLRNCVRLWFNEADPDLFQDLKRNIATVEGISSLRFEPNVTRIVVSKSGSEQETVKACPFIGFGLERFCPGALGCQRWSSGPQCFRAEGPCLMAAFRILQTTGN